MRRNYLTALGVLCGTLCAASLSQAALVHHWAFDEGTGDTAADSAGASPGAIDGAAWATGTGDRASYLSFDGSDDSVNPSLTLPSLGMTNDFSWAVWANSQEEFTPSTGNQRNAIIIGNRRDGNDADYSPREFIKFTPQRFEWRPQDMPNNAEYGDLPFQEWVHLAVVKDGDSLQAYFNGVPAGSTTIVNDFANAMAFFIGGEPRPGNTPRGSEHFNGFIDDVRLYDHALSAAEVGDLAGIPEPGTLTLLALAGTCMFASRKQRTS